MSTPYLNQVLFVGRLGKDPEHKRTANGGSMSKFSMALSHKYRDYNGELRENIDWVNITCWGDLAKITESIGLKKGDLVYVEAKVSSRSYQDETSGNKVSYTEFTALRVQRLAQSMSRQYSEAQPEPTQEEIVDAVMDDDLPF